MCTSPLSLSPEPLKRGRYGLPSAVSAISLPGSLGSFAMLTLISRTVSTESIVWVLCPFIHSLFAYTPKRGLLLVPDAIQPELCTLPASRVCTLPSGAFVHSSVGGGGGYWEKVIHIKIKVYVKCLAKFYIYKL